MQTLLKKYFGYESFRPLQDEVIQHVMTQQDALVLMPTGGGKSLCFQLPALAFPHMTLVVSPLIALMKDQVDALCANGIAAAYISSTRSPQENAETQKRALQGEIKILYLAPERLAAPGFQSFLHSLRVSLLAIDEAHCISEWGHDFRPDYRNLVALRQTFPNVPLIALTATANDRVRQDILTQLHMEHARSFVAGFNRANLNYSIRPKRQAFERLIALLQKNKNSSAIIYCGARKTTERLAIRLQRQGFNALPYHAGLTPLIRTQTQEKFIRDEISIIVATIAFGMGIDKPDVRTVVHMDLPKSIEAYYQETGRAGRDGLPSDCVLFYSPQDRRLQEFFIEQMADEAEQRRAREQLRRMMTFCEDTGCRRKFLLEYFGETWSHASCGACDNCADPQQDTDMTAHGLLLLQAIKDTGERFGGGYVIDVISGSRKTQITERGHDKLSIYGQGGRLTRDEAHHILQAMLGRGLLRKYGEQYPCLALTEKGRQVLTQRTTILLPRYEAPSPTTRSDAAGTQEYDKELFEQLRVLRRRLAEDGHIAPYMVFGDRTLHDMARYYPQTIEGLRRMFGVGQRKIEAFGQAFLQAICAYAKEHNLSERTPEIQPSSNSFSKSERIITSGSTYDETRRLAEQGLSVREIATRRALNEGTIIGHLEQLLEAKQLKNLPSTNVAPEKRTRIEQTFQRLRTWTLTPVRNALGEDFSFDEVKSVRLEMKWKDESNNAIR